MSEQKQAPDNRSASQKIQDLENAMISLYQNQTNVGRDLNAIKDTLRLLNNKVDSIVKAASAGETITNDVIDRIMIQNNVDELSEKVKVMIAQGILAPSEAITELSFVVGSELNDEGTTVNPRLQFALQALQPEIRGKFIGAKIGDVLNLQEGKLKFKVTETYEIQQPKAAEESAPVEATAATEAAPAASNVVDESTAANEAAPAPAQPDQSVTTTA